MTSHTIALSAFQVEVLLDTLEGFVDNKKLMHIPDTQGEIVGLPFTEELLRSIIDYMEEKQVEGKVEMRVELENLSEEKTLISVHMLDQVFKSEVCLDEFDAM